MKILSILALTASVVTAAPYVGVSLGFSSMKDNLKISGYDTDAVDKFSFEHKKNSRLNTFMFGLLGGYAFKLNDKVSVLAEADVNFGSKKKTVAKFDAHPNGLQMQDMEITSRRKHSVGFMPAISYNFNDKLNGLFGLRLNWTKYEVTGHITSTAVDTHELVKKSKQMMGIEPTFGLGYKVNDKVSTRLTVGYNFGKKKTIINNIVTNADQLAADESAGKITINPRGVNVRLAAVYSF